MQARLEGRAIPGSLVLRCHPLCLARLAAPTIPGAPVLPEMNQDLREHAASRVGASLALNDFEPLDGNAYDKLGIRSRDQLATALEAD